MSDRWAFTSWKRPVINEKLAKYLIWQKELCPKTKLEHYQGYIEFNRKYTLGNVKTIFKDKTIHAEIATKDRKANYIYCTKNESYAGERYEMGDIDTGIFDELNDVFNLTP